MSKEMTKNHRFHLNGEIEEVTASGSNDLTFDDMQKVFHNWMNRVEWVTKNGGESTLA
jgi:hypothetical protein